MQQRPQRKSMSSCHGGVGKLPPPPRPSARHRGLRWAPAASRCGLGFLGRTRCCPAGSEQSPPAAAPEGRNRTSSGAFCLHPESVALGKFSIHCFLPRTHGGFIKSPAKLKIPETGMCWPRGLLRLAPRLRGSWNHASQGNPYQLQGDGGHPQLCQPRSPC